MMERNSLLTPYSNGQIDNFAGKPPLFYWFQMISVNLFGFNEFSVRLPAAISGALTALICFAFIKKHFSLILAVTTVLILITAKGFVTFHSARTGDMDSTLTLGVTGLLFYFYNYVSSGNSRNLILCLLFLMIAFFVKSFAALFILPVMATFLFLKRKNIFKESLFWLSLLVFGTALGLFLYSREKQLPGYISDNFLRDINRTSSITNVDHDKPFDFYFNNLFLDRFPLFIVCVLPALIFALKEENKKLKDFILLNFFSALFILLLLSFSKSKCFWYDMPVFPMLSVVSAYFLWKLITLVLDSLSLKNMVALTLSCVFIFPVYFACKRSFNNDIANDGLGRAEVVADYLHKNRDNLKYDKLSVVNEYFIGPLLFYKYSLKEKDKQITIASVDKLDKETVLLTGNDSIKKYVQSHYETEVLENYKHATIYKIKQPKIS
jgi:4-amino-4-deoxy-L-arabinose transferase-like glycosyltransferase